MHMHSLSTPYFSSVQFQGRAATSQRLRSEGEPTRGFLLAGADSKTAGRLASGAREWAEPPLSLGQPHQEGGLGPGRELGTHSADPDCIRRSTLPSSSCAQIPSSCSCTSLHNCSWGCDHWEKEPVLHIGSRRAEPNAKRILLSTKSFLIPTELPGFLLSGLGSGSSPLAEGLGWEDHLRSRCFLHGIEAA